MALHLVVRQWAGGLQSEQFLKWYYFCCFVPLCREHGPNVNVAFWLAIAVQFRVHVQLSTLAMGPAFLIGGRRYPPRRYPTQASKLRAVKSVLTTDWCEYINSMDSTSAATRS